MSGKPTFQELTFRRRGFLIAFARFAPFNALEWGREGETENENSVFR